LLKKKSTIIAFIAIMVVSLSVALIFILRSPAEPLPETDPRSFEEIFWESDTVDEAIEIFDKKISSAPTPEEKANLYTERSKFLFELPFNDENTFKDKILSDLLEADSLEKSPDSAYILYDRYSFFGDKEKSEYYLNLYYDRIQKEE